MSIQQFNRAEVWTRYWASGAQHSCAGSYADRYGETITSYWQHCFEMMPPGCRVLDIGSGNAPLPKALLDLKDRPDISCDAIDIAEVVPSWIGELPISARQRVRFHCGCQAEHLPFAANSFDLVVSQWGLEYSELHLSVPEILRVVKPKGCIQLLLHHPQSLPVSLAHHEIAHIQWLLENSGYLEAAERMLAPMALAATPEGREQLRSNLAASATRVEFNNQQDALKARVASSKCPDVLSETQNWTQRLFGVAQQFGFIKASAAMENVRVVLKDSLFRQRELCQHVMSADACAALGAQLARDGNLSQGILQEGGQVMGWTLRVYAST